MASYKLLVRTSVRKDLRVLPREVLTRVLRQFESLANDPLPKGSLKLAGSEHRYRIRVGEYRIVYELRLDTGEVIIHYVRHRREAYRQR